MSVVKRGASWKAAGSMARWRETWRLGVVSIAGAGVLIAGSVSFSPSAHAVPQPCLDLFDPSSGGYVGATPGAYECIVEPSTGEYAFIARAGYGGSASAGGGGVAPNAGAPGAKITGLMQVTPGETLVVRVGAAGVPTYVGGAYIINAGATGGGASGITRGGVAYVVAGGGGGDGFSTVPNGFGRGGAGGVGPAGSVAPGSNGANANFQNPNEVFGGQGGGTSVGGAGGASIYGQSLYGSPGGSGGAPGVAGGAGTSGGSGGGGPGWSLGLTALAGGTVSDCYGAQGYSAPPVADGGGGGSCSGGGGGGYTGGGAGGVINAYGASGGGGSSLIPLGAVAVTSGTGSDLLPRVELTFSAPAPSPSPSPSGGGGTGTATTCTISFSSNGGTGSVEPVAGPAGSWASAPTGAGLTKAGFTFAGWNSTPDGTGLEIAPGGALLLSDSTTLFARWIVTNEVDPSSMSTQPSADEEGASMPLAAGESRLIADGRPVPVEVVPNARRNATALIARAPSLTPPLEMRLEGRGDQGDPLGLTAKQVLILESAPKERARAAMRPRAKSQGQPIASTSGSGFAPDSLVRLALLSDVELGSLRTDGRGAFDGRVPIPAGITPGVHTLRASGVAPDGTGRELTIGVVVTQSKERADRLTSTVTFAPLSAKLDDRSRRGLSRLAARAQNANWRTVVVGYVQPVGPTSNDDTLSQARARAVAEYLRDLGVEGTFIVRGDGRAQETGAIARRVEATLTRQ